MVVLMGTPDGVVCRVVFEHGSYWDIGGDHAEVAWMGWMNFWKGQKKVEVKVPCAIMEKLRQNVDVLAIAPEESTS